MTRTVRYALCLINLTQLSNYQDPIPRAGRRLAPQKGTIPDDDDVSPAASDDDGLGSGTEAARPKKKGASKSKSVDSPARRKRRGAVETAAETVPTALSRIPDEGLRNVMTVAVRHYHAQLISQGAYPDDDAEKDAIILSFIRAKKDWSLSELTLAEWGRRMV
jgi:hypothetical protein